MFLISKHYRDIIYYKAQTHLRSESSHTHLSFLWWALDPIISMGVYYVVFGVIFQRGTEDFVPFLLIGLVTWQWFANTISHCCGSINNNLALISQLNFPKIILPSVNIVMDGFKFSVVFCLLLIFLWAYGFKPGLPYLALPLVLFSQHCLNTVISNLVAALIPFVPDFQLIISNLLRIGMYFSGVLYAVSSLPEWTQSYFAFNPMVNIINSYRDILIYNRWPHFDHLIVVASVSFAGIVLTTLLLKKVDPIYPRVLMQK